MLQNSHLKKYQAFGIKKVYKVSKKTNWWTEDVKEAVAEKKRMWKKAEKVNTREAEKRYIEARNKARQVIKEAKRR